MTSPNINLRKSDDNIIQSDLKDNLYINEFARQRSLESANRLLLKLRQLGLNVVTAESLTAGLIAKTLVDIPTFGANVYGGIVVYDSDAKRKYLNVKTADVYSDQTAKEMAEGALLNSRAMVSIAVTGHAGPVNENDMDSLGMVDIGVSVRLIPNGNTNNKPVLCTETLRINNCTENPNYQNLCQLYKKEIQHDFGNCLPINNTKPFKCSSLGTLSLIRNIIRINTVARACNFALEVLIKLENEGKLPIQNNTNLLQLEEWDGNYIACGEPSYIIEKYLDKNSMKNRIDDITKSKSLTTANSFSEMARINPNNFKCPKDKRGDPQCLIGGNNDIYKSKYLKYKAKYLKYKTFNQ